MLCIVLHPACIPRKAYICVCTWRRPAKRETDGGGSLLPSNNQITCLVKANDQRTKKYLGFEGSQNCKQRASGTLGSARDSRWGLWMACSCSIRNPDRGCVLVVDTSDEFMYSHLDLGLFRRCGGGLGRRGVNTCSLAPDFFRQDHKRVEMMIFVPSGLVVRAFDQNP